jgi:hypothetical protein
VRVKVVWWSLRPPLRMGMWCAGQLASSVRPVQASRMSCDERLGTRPVFLSWSASGAAGIMVGAMSGDGKRDGPVRRPRVIQRPGVPPGPLADLKALVYELYLHAGTPTLDEMAAWVARDDGLAGAPGRDTINRIIGDTEMPPSQADVVAVVTVLAHASRWEPQDAARRARDLWVAGRMAAARNLAAGVRVSEADWRRLGVHAAISVPGASDEVPPEYVPRDADGGEFGVRAKVTAAARRGGFVLLVGGSSVGKTRCAVEAVKALMADWWLVHPSGVGEIIALAAAPGPSTVVWLDELQRYLDGERGLTGGVIRALLNAPPPVVIIGTLWPDLYTAYTTVPAYGGADPRAQEREVLDLAEVIRINPEFTPAEHDRARGAAARDPRVRAALGAAGYGLTQTLAAAPQLVARWQDAQSASPYGWAVLTAALDAARLGARAPLTAGFLRAAAPGYCTRQQQAEAPDDWFEHALAYATGKLNGAAAALSPAGAGMGHVAGYIVADYLVQHAGQERHLARVPASTWDAVITHMSDPADTGRLAESAGNRLLYRYAVPLWRRAADAGDRTAAMHLAWRLSERGDLDELRAWADTGEELAALFLAQQLGERGDLSELRTRADAGSRAVAWHLAGLLAKSADPDELRARADAGDDDAASRLARLLAERGDLDKAAEILRALADAGNQDAAMQLAELLAEHSDLDGAAEILRALADAGTRDAAVKLARLLARRSDLEELRARADAADHVAAWELAERLAERGDVEELRARADTGDNDAAWWLDGQLAERGDLDELRLRADADPVAAWWLAWLLAQRGDVDELRAHVGAGHPGSALQLAQLLVQRGRLDEAAQLIGAQVNSGDENAGWQLPKLLSDLLLRQGRGEEAEQLRRFGLNPDGSIARS